METFTYIIKAPLGLHARPAGLLVQEAALYQVQGTLKANHKEASLKSIIGLMSLGIKKDTEITLSLQGEDAKEAMAALKKIITSKL